MGGYTSCSFRKSPLADLNRIFDINHSCTPHIVHPDKRTVEQFHFYPTKTGGLLVGTLNFLNEPGIFELRFIYESLCGKRHEEALTFSINSPKLNTKHDYLRIIQTINHAYNDFVFRFLTLTFQQFKLKGRNDNDIIWMTIYRSISNDYIKAIEYILNRPNISHRHKVAYKRPDKIKRWSPKQIEYYHSLSDERRESTFIREEYIESSNDTKENRFVKFTIDEITKRIHELISHLKSSYKDRIDITFLQDLQGHIDKLNKLSRHRMLRSVGRFEGFRQESIVLQKRTGYSQVYKLWLMLRSGIEFYYGSTSIGLRKIWELYEVWCFLKMKEMITEILEIDPYSPDKDSYLEEDKQSTMDFFGDGHVEHKVVFHSPLLKGDTVTLHYQHEYARNGEDTFSATTIQRPDIVLNISKKDSDLVLTYLYDAKYRVYDDINNSSTPTDEPAPDAINQMHRYRDAIYYSNDNKQSSAKEVIGGYILFPGRGNEDNIKNQYFYKSIDSINIGAFPLLPDSKHPNQEGSLLKNHLTDILIGRTNTYEQIKSSIPQKGLAYTDNTWSEGLVYCGYVKGDNPQKGRFMTGTATSYYTGTIIDPNIDISKIRFFLPIKSDRGNKSIWGYYRVTAIRSDLRKKEGHKDSIRIFFELSQFSPIFNTWTPTAINHDESMLLSELLKI